MRLRRIAYRARRPVTVTASLAVVALAFFPVEARTPAPTTMRRVVATPVPIPVFTPTEMVIPRIGLRAPVVPVGTEADGTMGSPRNAVDIGWWAGRKPGEGNVLFDAHRNWSGALGSFARLKELEPGDKVIVKGKNKTLTYRVTWLRNFERNIDATDLLGNKEKKQVVTLITCEGFFDRSLGTSVDRLVARAELAA